MTQESTPLSPNHWTAHLALCVSEACRLEATARKPGNVHPEASFSDVRWTDFVRSGESVAPILAQTGSLGVGAAVLEAVGATRREVGTNTNLGIVLLLAPLAAVPERLSLREGIAPILDGLTREDAVHVYEAIRVAAPGGLGKASEGDVAADPTGTLLEMMRLAADRDAVAAEYSNRFETVLEFGLAFLASQTGWETNWERAIIGLHLRLMARRPDTLILRKRGREEAEESSRRAAAVLDSGWPGTERSRERLAEFDAWLRAAGNQRNPGTTADIVTACLFAALRQCSIPRRAAEHAHLRGAAHHSERMRSEGESE